MPLIAIPLSLGGSLGVYLLARLKGAHGLGAGKKPPLDVLPPVVRPPIGEPPPVKPTQPSQPTQPTKPVEPPSPPPDDDAELPTPPVPSGPSEPEPTGPLPPAPTPEDVEPEPEPSGPAEPPTPAPDEPEGEAEVPTPEPPAPTPEVPEPEAPEPEQGPPAGFDAERAIALAAGVKNMLKAKGYDYARDSLKAFQLAAGVAADGIYGGETWGALDHIMGGGVPKALFKPVELEPYKWAALIPYGAGAEVVLTVHPPVNPPAPKPTTPVTPAPATPTPVTPAPSSTPAGFNAAQAIALAPKVAADLKREFDYDRALMRQFQMAAGLTVDGIYGGASWGALDHIMGGNVQKALFKPTALEEYKFATLIPRGAGASASPVASPSTAPTPAPAPLPPVDEEEPQEPDVVLPAGTDFAKARKMAPQVAGNLSAKGKANYDRALLKSFQKAAGIDVDGSYGPESRGALQYFGTRPPVQFVLPGQPVKPYKWAEFAG